jgi:hypothetical protein
VTGETQGISKQARQRWQELADAATPSVMVSGEWSRDSLETAHGHEPEDADFIAAARTAVPALLAALADRDRELTKLRAKIAKMEDAFEEWEETPNLYSPAFAARFLRAALNDDADPSAPPGQEER